jgi:hypothetical protein
MSEVDILISHSRQDASLASRLAELLKSALNVESSRIGCTSAYLYSPPEGEQARRELFKASVLIALLPPPGVQSSRVFFELGARWESSRPLLLTTASRYEDLSGIPLYEHDVNVLSDAVLVKKLIKRVGTLLDEEPVNSKQFGSLVEEFIKAADSNGDQPRMLLDRMSNGENHDDESLLQIRRILSGFDSDLFLTPFEAGLSLTELGSHIRHIRDGIDRSYNALGCEEKMLIDPISSLLEPLGNLVNHMRVSQTTPVHGLVLDACRAQLIERTNVISETIGSHQYLSERALYIGVRSNPSIRYYLLDSRITEAAQLIADAGIPEKVLSEYAERLEELL